MSTTTDTSTEAPTPVRSSILLSLTVGDDARISVAHFTNHPRIGCYDLKLDDVTVYLTESSARALVKRLSQALAAARGESA